jgi:SAM-dependent methyltransferase
MTNFSGTEFGNKAVGFDRPTQLPRDDAQRKEWQSANKSWWESSPMRYDWRDEIAVDAGSEAYFAEIDRRFFSSARKYLPWQKVPFDAIVPYEQLRDQDVLEIGVGQGTHAQLLAPRSKSFTGIDLTSYAGRMTAHRLRLSNIPGKVLQMDAEDMGFPEKQLRLYLELGSHSSFRRHGPGAAGNAPRVETGRQVHRHGVL